MVRTGCRRAWRWRAPFVAVVVVALASPAWAGYRQRGVASTDPLDHNAIGARSWISPPNMPQTVVDGAAVFTWVGSGMANGDFYQVGWAVNWSVGSCTAGLRGIFSASADAVGNWQFGCTSTHFTGTTHRFTMQYNATTNEWQAFVDSEYLGGSRRTMTATNIGNNAPVAVSELGTAGSALPSASDEMGPSNYSPALQTRFGTTWYDSYSANVYSWNADCGSSGAPYNTILGGYNNIGAGSDFGHSCTHNGDSAW